MGRRAVTLLAFPLLGVLGACVVPPRLTTTGIPLAGPATYRIIGDDQVSPAAQAALAGALAKRGLTPASSSAPDLFVALTLADRPLATGSFDGSDPPIGRNDRRWTDRPRKAGLFGKGRREVRLTIRFLTPAGVPRDTLVATAVVPRTAPPADMAAMIDTAFRLPVANRAETAIRSPDG
jgi:hypothetical protein